MNGPDANFYYLEGRKVIADPSNVTAQGTAEARRLFEDAIRLDPEFAEAHAELGGHMRRVANANPMYAARKGEVRNARADAQRDDPNYASARALCDMAALAFNGLHRGAFMSMREAWPEGPDRKAYGFRVDTDRGPRIALFYMEGALFKRRLAVLMKPGEPLPLGSLSLSKRDFAAIVPG